MLKINTIDGRGVQVVDLLDGARRLQVADDSKPGGCAVAANLTAHEAREVSQALMPHPEATGETSDGYHTFNELYDHRRALTAALLAVVTKQLIPDMKVWRSRKHHPLDSECYAGYFIVGLELPTGYTITYHYADQYWDDFQHVPEVEHAPRWDGAPPAATVTRLVDYARR